MPTGETASVSIEEILIQRGDRIRRELDPGAINALADSIRRIGLVHFPVVRRDMVLVSGERRITAAKTLGWDRIQIQWSDTLSDTEHLEIELEENIKRLDLPWQDQCDAMHKYHELKAQQNPGWTQTKTAESIGVSQGTVASYLQVAKEIAAGNKRVIDAPRMSTAKGIVKRKLEREASDFREKVLGLEGVVPTHPFIMADFNEWAPAYDGPPFNLVHCDFPYGINVESFHQGASDSYGGYKDDFKTYFTLVETLIENKDTLMGESAHLIFWFSMKHYTWTLEKLREHFWIDPYPLVWFKSDNKGTLPDPERGPRRVYEVAFLCSHGDRKIIAPKSNLFPSPTVREGDHMSEKSTFALQHFLSMVADTGTRMLDPTCGSGSALRAARSLGVNNVLGLERDQSFYDNAIRAWK